MRRLGVAVALVALAAPATASAALSPDARVERADTTGTVSFVGLPPGTADRGHAGQRLEDPDPRPDRDGADDAHPGGPARPPRAQAQRHLRHHVHPRGAKALTLTPARLTISRRR